MRLLVPQLLTVGCVGQSPTGSASVYGYLREEREGGQVKVEISSIEYPRERQAETVWPELRGQSARICFKLDSADTGVLIRVVKRAREYMGKNMSENQTFLVQCVR